MISNELLANIALRSLKEALVVDIILAIICFANICKKKLNISEKLERIGTCIFVYNIFIGSALIIVALIFSKITSYKNVIPVEKNVQTQVVTKEQEREIIEIQNVIVKENVINIPSIMLPLQPEGEQAIVIDSSREMEYFMNDFYGDNVEFFNQRQNATYISDLDGLHNYTGLNIKDIQYEDVDEITTLNLDELNYQTVWLFTDLKHIRILPTQCNVFIYVPNALTEEKIRELKTLGNVTIITIESI